jgi:molecular chaperone HscC
MPRGQSAIDVRYTYDINGLLEIEVTSIETGQTKREVIINSDNQLSAAEIEVCLKRLSSLKIHPRDQQKNRLLLARAERLYEESLGETREHIGYQARVFEAVLNKQDPHMIENASAAFAAFLDDIERRV